MSGKGKPKPKKVIETTLGQAPKEGEKPPDLAHLRKPIETSVKNFMQILDLFQNATSEVRDYITYECDILYECRICRTIFRSLANLILHKRSYCREKFQFSGGGSTEATSYNISEKTSDDESRPTSPDDVTKKKISPVIDKLIKKQKIQILNNDLLNEDLSKDEEILEDDDVIFVSEENLILEKIKDSNVAVFQTKNSQEETIKDEILEIHSILDDNQVALGNNGKVCQFTTKKLTKNPKKELVCSECNFSFSTEKTLTHHIKFKHNKTCQVFSCPECKENFSNTWSLYRHLYKTHQKTPSQVRRMRTAIHSSRIQKSQEPEKKTPVIVEENEENQWMKNFENKDLQMCSGCGKRFERKAALHSHSQMCTKRIALCNSIKNVKGLEKKKEKNMQLNEVKLKGAAKRKSQVARHVIKDPLADDVTITKETGDAIVTKPEVEILTISDDSNDEKKSSQVEDDFKEFIQDEEDVAFIAQMSNYIDKSSLKCQSCDLTFLSIYRLLRHMSGHFSWYRYQCSKCNFMSFHKLDCTTHAYSQHSTPTTLIDSTVLPIPKWKVLCTSHFFKNDEEETMPRLEAIEENESIVLEDDEMPDITENGSETLVLSDDEKKKEEAGPSVAAKRPIRNRTKSVKTVQNDFIYDMTKVLKLDSGSKRKVKKTVKT